MPGWQMAGDDRDILSDTTVGDRDAGVRGGGECRGHPRDNRAPHAGEPARLRLLAAAAEQERVPALEPDDHTTLKRPFDQQRVDAVLRAGERASALAAMDDLRFGPDIPENVSGHQAVSDDDIGHTEQFPTTNGK